MKKQIVLFVVLLVAMIFMVPSLALAQSAETPDPFGDSSDEIGDMDSGSMDESASADESAIELPLKKRAKVVQKKLYPRAGKHELSLFFGINGADSFVVSLVEGLRYNYHITELFGVQVTGGYLQNFDKPDATLLTDTADKGGLNIDENFIKNAEIEWFVGADFVFYPVYGKFSLMSDVIAHYDIGIYAGCAVMALNTDSDAYRPAPDLGLVANIYFNSWLSLRADFMYYALIAVDNRAEPTAGEGGNIGDTGSSDVTLNKRGGTLLRHNLFVTLGISFHLPVE